MSGEPAVEVPDQALRAALEFAIAFVAVGTKLRPPLAFPAELKRFLRFDKLPPVALAQVRAAIEGDDDFRRRLAALATPELVDEVGMLWLSRPDGWTEEIADSLPEKSLDDDTAIRREERRRRAAQESAARARSEVVSVVGELARERAATADAAAEADRLRAELDELRHRLRDAQRAEHAATQALAKAEAALVHHENPADAALLEHDDSAAIDAPPNEPAIDTAVVRKLIDGAVAASTDLTRLLQEALSELHPLDDSSATEPAPASGRTRRARRAALRLPGGVLAGSVEAAEFFLRSAGVTTLIDGYNVAKLGWPSLDLDHQRQQCISAAENLAKRWNIAMTIVFDGAAIEGAHAATRRRVRVVYSPAGVSADDVLRDEVASASADQPVVVVTNDRAIITDVVAAGANNVSSNAFLALSRR